LKLFSFIYILVLMALLTLLPLLGYFFPGSGSLRLFITGGILEGNLKSKLECFRRGKRARRGRRASKK
jgi:hypothetical protein